MAFDGLSVYTIAHELNASLVYSRIDKIHQPERDEVNLSIRSKTGNKKLLITCNPSHPRMHLTEVKKKNPDHPPMFCMLLRKHLIGGKILTIEQVGFDRIIKITIESKNEMGDMTKKYLIVEFMGKHSNIILVDQNNKILDSIKHVSMEVSSVRLVLPGVEYSLPPSDKLNPMALIGESDSFEVIKNKPLNLHRGLYNTFNGLSPLIASEILYRSGIDSQVNCSLLSPPQFHCIYNEIKSIANQLQKGIFHFHIYSHEGKMIDFSSIDITHFKGFHRKEFKDFSTLLEYYYKEKDNQNRILQKSYDLRKLLQNNIERCYKKKSIQVKQLQDTKGRDKYKLRGDLITANIYAIKKGDHQLETTNYYSEENAPITIALNPNLTPSENAQKFYKRYNKAKRTEEATIQQLKQTDIEINYLESLITSLGMAENEQDLIDIRQELFKEGYSKKPKQKGKPKQSSKPLTFKTIEGIEGLIGKNNTQNDELTFKTASPKDLWFHTKDIPGSHVILKCSNQDFTEESIYEAALMAAYYSKAKNSSTVPVDYTEKRHVKKPNGSKPGFVIYFHQKTIYVTPEEQKVNKLLQKE